MFKFLNLQPEVFAADITDASLKIAKLTKRMGHFEITSFNDVDIEAGVINDGIVQNQNALAEIIKKACGSVKGKKLRTKYVAISLPDEKAFMQVIKMPMMSESELQASIHFEVGNYIPLPVEKVYVGFKKLGSDHKENEAEHLNVLMSAMPRQIIDAYVGAFKKAGLVPCLMEVKSQAVIRALLPLGHAKPQSALVLHCSAGKISFIVFSGTYVSYTFLYPDSFTSIIAESLNDGNTSLQNLIGQIKKYVEFYHSHASYEHFTAGDTIAKIILSGEGADSKSLATFVSGVMKIPVEVGDPLVNITHNKVSSQITTLKKLHVFTAAIGLGLYPTAHPIFTSL
jgi:type IV pilus assembly protein PilM